MGQSILRGWTKTRGLGVRRERRAFWLWFSFAASGSFQAQTPDRVQLRVVSIFSNANLLWVSLAHIFIYTSTYVHVCLHFYLGIFLCMLLCIQAFSVCHLNIFATNSCYWSPCCLGWQVSSCLHVSFASAPLHKVTLWRKYTHRRRWFRLFSGWRFRKDPAALSQGQWREGERLPVKPWFSLEVFG